MLQRTQILNRTQFCVHAAYKYMIFCLGLDRRLPECERLNVTSRSHVRGQPQKVCSQICFQLVTFILTAWRHIAQELNLKTHINMGI